MKKKLLSLYGTSISTMDTCSTIVSVMKDAYVSMNTKRERVYIYIYSLEKDEWIAYHERCENRESNGKTKMVVKKDGKDIIVFCTKLNSSVQDWEKKHG